MKMASDSEGLRHNIENNRKAEGVMMKIDNDSEWLQFANRTIHKDGFQVKMASDSEEFRHFLGVLLSGKSGVKMDNDSKSLRLNSMAEADDLGKR